MGGPYGWPARMPRGKKLAALGTLLCRFFVTCFVSATLMHTVCLVLALCVLVAVLVSCYVRAPEPFGNRCPLLDGRASRCRHLSENECNQCRRCRWHIDQHLNGRCVHRNQFRPLQYLDNNVVYFGAPGRLPRRPPVRTWWGWPWGTPGGTSVVRRRPRFRRPRRFRRSRRRGRFTRDPWGRRIRVLN
jgi:hypothetical protein